MEKTVVNNNPQAQNQDDSQSTFISVMVLITVKF